MASEQVLQHAFSAHDHNEDNPRAIAAQAAYRPVSEQTDVQEDHTSALMITTVVTPLSLTAGSASAQEFYGRLWHHHHRDNEPPQPQPECWYQRQAVQNRYDDGYHYDNVRVCN